MLRNAHNVMSSPFQITFSVIHEIQEKRRAIGLLFIFQYVQYRSLSNMSCLFLQRQKSRRVFKKFLKSRLSSFGKKMFCRLVSIIIEMFRQPRFANDFQGSFPGHSHPILGSHVQCGWVLAIRQR